jgi:SAM-dependent methyltransferase
MPANYLTLYTESDLYHTVLQREVGHDPYVDRYAHDYDIAELRIAAFNSRLRILDVGCANGAFVQALRQRGIEAEGIEPNPTMAAFAAERSGARIHQSWNTVTPFFDAVFYHDVFEHILDPIAELAEVRDVLRWDSHLVIDVPDAGVMFDPIAPQATHHIRPEQHVHYYSEDVLCRLLEGQGFSIDCVTRPIVGKLVVYSRWEADVVEGDE